MLDIIQVNTLYLYITYWLTIASEIKVKISYYIYNLSSLSFAKESPYIEIGFYFGDRMGANPSYGKENNIAK